MTDIGCGTAVLAMAALELGAGPRRRLRLRPDGH